MPEEGLPVILQSLSASTIRQYDSAYRLWWTYCTEKQLSVYGASLDQVILFFRDLLDKRTFKYGSFNNIRSALSLIFPDNFSRHPFIKRFIRGISRLRPQRPRYEFTWDPQILLDFIHNLQNEELSLENLSKSVICLLALATAQRFQTFASIKVQNISFLASGEVLIFVPDILKTSRPGKPQPLFNFRPFTERPRFCLVRLLHEYIERTSDHRKNEECLFFLLQPLLKGLLPKPLADGLGTF